MEAIRKIIDHSSHEVVIELPESYQNRKLEVIVLMAEEELKDKKKYDYSKFYGTLEWTGDALAEQRKLRNEWE